MTNIYQPLNSYNLKTIWRANAQATTATTGFYCWCQYHPSEILEGCIKTPCLVGTCSTPNQSQPFACYLVMKMAILKVHECSSGSSPASCKITGEDYQSTSGVSLPPYGLKENRWAPCPKVEGSPGEMKMWPTSTFVFPGVTSTTWRMGSQDL